MPLLIMKYFSSSIIALLSTVDDELIRTIVAFLNTEGGTIYIGVDEERKVVGVNNVEEAIIRINDMVSSQIEPNPQEEVKNQIAFYEGKIIIVIKVPRGFSHIYCLKKYGYSPLGCPINIGTSTTSMTEAQIATRRRKRYETSDDLMIKSPSRYNDVSLDILSILLRNRRYCVTLDSVEQHYQLRTESGKYNMLAELLSDKNNIPLNFVKYKGKTKSAIKERNDYGHQSILAAYQEILSRLKAENICKCDTTQRPRVDTYLYDIDAVNEVLINAFIHNDWNVTEPLVSFFDDRLEIISHGGLPGGETKEMFFKGISNPRNAALMRIFHDLDIAEHNGHGIPTILSVYGESVFDIQDSYINVVIPFNKEVLDNHGNH